MRFALFCAHQVRTLVRALEEVKMSENTRFKTERLNLRCSADAVSTLRNAATAQNQDLTSFILGAALERRGAC